MWQKISVAGSILVFLFCFVLFFSSLPRSQRDCVNDSFDYFLLKWNTELNIILRFKVGTNSFCYVLCWISVCIVIKFGQAFENQQIFLKQEDSDTKEFSYFRCNQETKNRNFETSPLYIHSKTNLALESFYTWVLMFSLL